ncbi:hypothetical protein Tco_1269374, partial [Tanacetum coccineum]
GDFANTIEDPKTKLLIETPFIRLKDDEKRNLGKYNEAKMTLYNALPRKEYERVFMCKTAKEIWHTLIITHQGNSQVKYSKIDLLTQQYVKFLISSEETIDSGFSWFNAIVTSLKSLDQDYSKKKPCEKVSSCTPVKLESQKSDGVGSKTTREKIAPMDLKAKVTRDQTSNNSICQDESDEDKEINLIAKNFRKLFRKGIKKHDKFNICNDKDKTMGGERSRCKHGC